MRGMPNNIVAVLLAAAGVLALTLHSLYEDLLKSTALKFFGSRMGMSEAEVMSRLTEMALPLLAAIAIIWGIYKYLHSHISREMTEALRPRIQIEDYVEVYAERGRDGQFVGEHCFLSVFNPGNSILERCLVKVEALTSDHGKREILQASIRTEACSQDGHVGRFSLGPQERKRLHLTSRTGRPHAIGMVSLGLETGEMLLPRSRSFEIELIAMAETGQPQRRILNLSIDADIHVTTEWLS